MCLVIMTLYSPFMWAAHLADITNHLSVHVRQVDAPAAVIVETVRFRGDAVELSEVIEQRIARHRHQDLVAACCTEQLEQQRVRFAGARCQAIRFGSTATPRLA